MNRAINQIKKNAKYTSRKHSGVSKKTRSNLNPTKYTKSVKTNKAINSINSNENIKAQSGRFTSVKTDIQGATDRDLARMRMHDANINSATKQQQYYENKKLAKEQLREQQRQLKSRRLKAGIGVGAAGLYAGSDIVNRYRNGGTVDRNTDGERDIVGIPFF